MMRLTKAQYLDEPAHDVEYFTRIAALDDAAADKRRRDANANAWG